MTHVKENLTTNETPLWWWGGCIECGYYPCVCGEENYGKNYPIIERTMSSSFGFGKSFITILTNPYSFALLADKYL